MTSLLRDMWDETRHTRLLADIRQEVNKYVQTCESCQRNKISTQKPAGLLQPLPLPTHKWTDISMDFITQLPKTQSGYDAILVVVDRCTKVCHFIPTTTSVDAAGTAQPDNVWNELDNELR
jgi:hypothetical protein